MSANSKIEWCDSTFNPWIGCTKVSPACDHCYAERSTPSRTLGVVWGPHAERRRTSAENWKQPLRWEANAAEFQATHGRRQRVFCASLADVFDNAVPVAWRRDLFNLILSTPSLDWLLLTKRIGNAARMIDEVLPDNMKALPADCPVAWPWPNVWLGATICNQEEANRDIPKLQDTPAAVRFVSMEPLLGPVWLGNDGQGKFGGLSRASSDGEWTYRDHPLEGKRSTKCGEFSVPRIDWVIVGGESGPAARPMHPDWARSLRDQCEKAGVPFLFKQWGEWLPVSQQAEEFTHRLYRSNRRARLHEDQSVIDDCYGRTCTVEQAVIHEEGSVHAPLTPMAFRQGTGAMLTFKAGKKASGRLLDGREWNGVPV